MTRGGRKTDQDDPERKCIVTGEVQPKAGLIRFCLDDHGFADSTHLHAQVILGLETGDAEMLSQAIIADIAGAAQSIRATFRAAPRT